MRLFEISAHYRELADRLLASDTGEVSDADLASLDAIEGDLATKARNTLALIREWRTEGEAVKAEADRLAAIAKARSNAADRLQAYLVRCIDAAGVDRVPTDLGTVRVQEASRPSIRWEGDPLLIPTGFRRESVSLDGAAAYEAWKTGVLPAGFTAVKSRGLRVY